MIESPHLHMPSSYHIQRSFVDLVACLLQLPQHEVAVLLELHMSVLVWVAQPHPHLPILLTGFVSFLPQDVVGLSQ